MDSPRKEEGHQQADRAAGEKPPFAQTGVLAETKGSGQELPPSELPSAYSKHHQKSHSEKYSLPDLIRDLSMDTQMRGGFIKLSAVIFGFVIVVFILTVGIYRLLHPVTVTVNSNGALEISPYPTKSAALFLLSANGGENSPWIDTGVEIKPGDQITVSASGKINMAIHRLIDNALHSQENPNWGHDLPFLPWNGPDGIDDKAAYPPRQYRREDLDRAKYRLASNVNQGAVIGFISDSCPGSSPMDASQDDTVDKAILIGHRRSFTAQREGHLWLTVNEIWLGPDMSPAYEPKTNEEFQAQIVSNHYWNVWYDDNDGSFLVSIEITK
jgi:hypothetical protein